MESDDDLVRDEFFSTLNAHNEEESKQDFASSFLDGFQQQGHEIHKRSTVKPSKNPTHDKKYSGRQTTRRKIGQENHETVIEKKINKKNEHFGEEFSDYDSENFEELENYEQLEDGNIEDDDSEDDFNDSADKDMSHRPHKKRKVEVDSAISDDAESYSESLNDDQNEDDELDEEEDESDDENDSEGGSDDWVDLENVDDEPKSKRNKIDKSLKNSSKSKQPTSEISFFTDSFGKKKDTNNVADSQRGLALKKQLTLWEKYFQLRVLLQSSLQAANEIRPASIEKISKDNENYCELMKNLDYVLEKFLTIAEKSFDSLELKTELELDSSSSFEERIERLSKTLINEGPNLMQFWNDKIMLSMGKHTQRSSSFSGTNKNAMTAQIEGVLADRSRLLKRTRTKRVEYSSSVPDEEIPDDEIYDEYDFYQNLVKDLISSRSSATNQYLNQQQNSNLKLKNVKSITTQLVRKHKAIVFDIHAKLVGFTAPKPSAEDWRDDAIDSLSLSIFGN